MSRHQTDVATSIIFNWRRDIRVVLRHEDSSLEYFLFRNSIFCCLGHPGRNLNLQVTTSLAKVFYFFPKIDFGDVVTWN